MIAPPQEPTPKEADWYDEIYRQPHDYQAHYTQSRYYFLWSVIADRLIRSGVRRVLELGCGTGQFAGAGMLRTSSPSPLSLSMCIVG